MYKKHIKRLLDIILSLLAIIITLPIFLIVGIIVLIFIGKPVLFRQKRPGKNEQIFTMYKFRTMTNKKDKDGNLLPDEVRLTKLGKLLRKTSLDEIPEFINILKGDMSFVGPRPLLIRDMVFMSDKIRKRHTVRPGLTGLAQVSGRNAITWDNKFKYDLEYIKNITFINDLKIMIKTFFSVIKREGIGSDGSDLSLDYGDYLLKNNKISKEEYGKKQKEALILMNQYNHITSVNDLVSVIMPAYNTEKYIKESIDSVLNQTYKNLELIIINDCSTDNTEKKINEFKDKRIKYIKNTKNSGAAISRNKALQEAKGRLIAFLDSDDIWMPEKLEKQIDFMIKNNYYFSYTKYEEIDGNSKSLNKVITGPAVINKKKMYDYCWPGCLTVMYDREKIGLIQIRNLAKNNDYAIWLKAIEKANCYLLNENLAKYRIREGSISRNSKFKLIKYHYIMYKEGFNKNTISSLILTMRNLFFGIIKKIKYNKRI